MREATAFKAVEAGELEAARRASARTLRRVRIVSAVSHVECSLTSPVARSLAGGAMGYFYTLAVTRSNAWWLAGPCILLAGGMVVAFTGRRCERWLRSIGLRLTLVHSPLDVDLWEGSISSAADDDTVAVLMLRLAQRVQRGRVVHPVLQTRVRTYLSQNRNIVEAEEPELTAVRLSRLHAASFSLWHLVRSDPQAEATLELIEQAEPSAWEAAVALIDGWTLTPLDLMLTVSGAASGRP